ncbi:MAG: hypothetical protein H6709_06310 [Kofleriaceae bacterium]|nr:hypothetical protein [Myxococcales bacterium]MCB9560383.1 hypothetical protein [Kofleriaceae bacterium]MCB9571688.1 hypothetical protein [Kofleriaceae bacterium]
MKVTLNSQQVAAGDGYVMRLVASDLVQQADHWQCVIVDRRSPWIP